MKNKFFIPGWIILFIVLYGVQRPSFQDYLNAIAGNPNIEHSTSLLFCPEESGNLRYYFYNIEHGITNKVNFNGGSSNILADMHSHPNNATPSPKDIMAAAEAMITNPVFKYLYVYAGGDIYALYIEDKAKAAAFALANPNCVDENNEFIKGTRLEREWTNALTRYNDLQGIQKKEYTIADILNKNNTGIKFLKKESGDNSFKAINVKKNDYTGYTSPVVCK